jgi:hypothetical protein
VGADSVIDMQAAGNGAPDARVTPQIEIDGIAKGGSGAAISQSLQEQIKRADKKSDGKQEKREITIPQGQKAARTKRGGKPGNRIGAHKSYECEEKVSDRSPGLQASTRCHTKIIPRSVNLSCRRGACLVLFGAACPAST